MGRGVLRISNDGDDRRVLGQPRPQGFSLKKWEKPWGRGWFWGGLKFLIPGFFWVRKFGSIFPGSLNFGRI